MQFPSLEESNRRTQTLICLSSVSKSWFRVATPLLYEVIRIYRPTIVPALIRAPSEAPVLPEHTKQLSFDIDHSGDGLETNESNPNPSQAFQNLASCCLNLCVVPNRCPEPDDDQHPNAFPSFRLYDEPLSYRVKLIYNTSFCLTLRYPRLTAYGVSLPTPARPRPYANRLDKLCRGICQHSETYEGSLW